MADLSVGKTSNNYQTTGSNTEYSGSSVAYSNPLDLNKHKGKGVASFMASNINSVWTANPNMA